MALGLPGALWALVPVHKVKTKSPEAEARSAVGDKSPEDIARTLKLDKGLRSPRRWPRRGDAPPVNANYDEPLLLARGGCS
jgi:hypothetical protein